MRVPSRSIAFCTLLIVLPARNSGEFTSFIAIAAIPTLLEIVLASLFISGMSFCASRRHLIEDGRASRNLNGVEDFFYVLMG